MVETWLSLCKSPWYEKYTSSWSSLPPKHLLWVHPRHPGKPRIRGVGCGVHCCGCLKCVQSWSRIGCYCGALSAHIGHRGHPSKHCNLAQEKGSNAQEILTILFYDSTAVPWYNESSKQQRSNSGSVTISFGRNTTPFFTVNLSVGMLTGAAWEDILSCRHVAGLQLICVLLCLAVCTVSAHRHPWLPLRTS